MIHMSSQQGTIPPELWIRELNRLIPSLWTDLRKSLEGPLKHLKPEARVLLENVPDWCPMPTFFPGLALAKRLGHDVYLRYRDVTMTMASMYLWRAGKGVYRFDPELYGALIRQPFSGDIPNEVLFYLPEWAVYIETPGIVIAGLPIDGFIAHLDYNLYNRDTDLQFAIFRHGIPQPKMLALPLGEGGLLEAMHRVDAIDSIFGIPKANQIGVREDYRLALSSMIQLLLYLCSEKPDMPAIEHPRNRRTLSGGVRSSEEAKVWDVGMRIGGVLRKAATAAVDKSLDGDTPIGEDTHLTEGRSHARPRAHIRSAHWTTYWTGPRSGEQKALLRWIPPLPINVDWKQPMPTAIHPVKAM